VRSSLSGPSPFAPRPCAHPRCCVPIPGIIHQHFATWYDAYGDAVFSQHAPQAAWAQIWEQRPVAIIQILLFLTGLELTAGKQDPEKAPGQLGR
jgi:hypothetical protein